MALRSNELMIGDWVLHHNDGCIDAMNDTAPYDEAIRIERDDFELDECFWGRLDPIPLTAEIIEKNTDMKRVDSDSVTTYTFNDGIHATNVRMKGGIFSALGVPISYVHDLQHALRLVGVDKEITI